uniref:PAM2 domain-containing protein n=1 Tax=Heterorhabditis bacteriophora TaxID=37862 RepID=A0A1I7XC00_HETBA
MGISRFVTVVNLHLYKSFRSNTVANTVSHTPYADPPPPYQSAMTYPAAPYGQSSMNPTFPPRPVPNYPHLAQPPVYYPSQPNERGSGDEGNGYVLYAVPDLTYYIHFPIWTHFSLLYTMHCIPTLL